MDVNVNLSEASIVSDRVYWGLFLCQDLAQTAKKTQLGFSLGVYYNPKEIAETLLDGESIFRVPVKLIRDPENLGKMWVPIFMLVLSANQKNELAVIVKGKGSNLLYKYFTKPRLNMSYEERQELFEV